MPWLTNGDKMSELIRMINSRGHRESIAKEIYDEAFRLYFDEKFSAEQSAYACKISIQTLRSEARRRGIKFRTKEEGNRVRQERHFKMLDDGNFKELYKVKTWPELEEIFGFSSHVIREYVRKNGLSKPCGNPHTER